MKANVDVVEDQVSECERHVLMETRYWFAELESRQLAKMILRQQFTSRKDRRHHERRAGFQTCNL